MSSTNILFMAEDKACWHLKTKTATVSSKEKKLPCQDWTTYLTYWTFKYRLDNSTPPTVHPSRQVKIKLFVGHASVKSKTDHFYQMNRAKVAKRWNCNVIKKYVTYIYNINWGWGMINLDIYLQTWLHCMCQQHDIGTCQLNPTTLNHDMV